MNFCEHASEMQLELKYVYVYVNQVEVAADFLITKLGFTSASELAGIAGRMTLQRGPGQCCMILAEAGTMPDLPPGRIVLCTSDCLKDYYLLEKAQVQFVNVPQYIGAGLAVDFRDPAGNMYTLFEEREYSEEWRCSLSEG